MNSRPMPEKITHRIRFSEHCRALAKSPTTVPERTAAMAGVINKTIHMIIV